MFFYIQISSKNKSILISFLDFISKLKIFNLYISYFPKQQVKKFITVLKSPHVNKSAQEQFEYRIYTKKLSIKSPQSLKVLLLLKKVKNYGFPGINLKINSVFVKKKELKNVLTFMNPDNFNTNFFQTSKYSTHNFIKKYAQILDSYGEYSIKIL